MKKRLLSQKRLSQLVYSIGMILLSINVGWGQQVIGSFPYMDGGFEGQQTATSLTATGTGTANIWTKQTATSTSIIINNASSARSGSKYAAGNLAASASNRGLQSPAGTPPTAASYVIQFYSRNLTFGTTLVSGIFGTNGVATTAGTTSVWTKTVSVMTSATSANFAYVGRLNSPTSTSYDVDDVVVYAGATVDETAPAIASVPTATGITGSQQTIGWTAATALSGEPVDGVDGGGYMVVRGLADPTTAPNANGIYAVGNTVATGETVVYLGTGTSFTDTGLAESTQYYYRIYTVDKAFNYSSALPFNSTTAGAVVLATEPTTAASGLVFSNVTATGFDISWTAGNGSNSLVVVKAVTDVNADPTDGTIYTPSLTFGSGTQIGTVNYVVFNGTGNSASITGLTLGTTYYVKVYTFNVNAPGSENYLITSPASGFQKAVPYQNTFTFDTTTEGFTAVSPRATATYASELGTGTVQWKYLTSGNNALNSKVILSANYAKVDGTTYKYAHITLKNTTLTNNSIQLNSSTAVAFNPRQNVSVNDSGYKTYDFDLTGWTGDQQPELNMFVKTTWSALPTTYAPGDIVILSNTYYKSLTGDNSAIDAAALKADTLNWAICDVTGAVAPAPGAVIGGALDLTNFVYIDSIVFDNVPPSIVSNGTGGGAWSTGTTWAGGVAPATNDNVTILGSDTVNSTGTTPICSNLNVTGILNITGGKLTVKNTLVNNGTITIDNNANLVQTTLLNTNSGSGTATVKRNSNALFRLDYTMWSSPVSGVQTLAGFSPNTSQSPNRFFTYNPATNLYVNVSPTSTFSTGAGYLIRMPNEDPTTDYNTGGATLAYPGQFTGTLNNGTVSVTTNISGGYYSVGNPYPSTIDATAFLGANTTDGTLYFWRKTNAVANSTGSAYATWTTFGSAASNVAPNDIIPNGTIQVGQGFIVKSNAASLSFTNAMRLGTASIQFFKTKQVAEKSRVWLNLTNTTGVFSQALVGYVDGATLGVDNGIDGKYINDSSIALTSNINGEEYTIQGRPAFDATDEVALNFKTDVAGDYTIAIDHTDGLFATGQDIYLKDNNTGTETNLKAGTYTFTASAGVDNSRFSLKYQKTLKVDDAIFNENNVTVYAKNGSLYVNSGEMAINSIQVYDVQGRLLTQRKALKTTTAIIENLKANNQVLLVKILGENNKAVTKKVVN